MLDKFLLRINRNLLHNHNKKCKYFPVIFTIYLSASNFIKIYQHLQVLVHIQKLIGIEHEHLNVFLSAS